VATASLRAIAEELNERAQTHQIGALQELRGHRPGVDLFWPNSKAFASDWAFHWGGRRELQFNIGFWDSRHFRHGVAFSLRESREYKTDELMEVLLPKMKRFNQFVRLYPKTFAGMFLWIWDDDKEKDMYYGRVSPIPLKRVAKNMFIFIGRRLPRRQLDYERILDDFDMLLPAWRHVERPGNRGVVSVPLETQFTFRPGCRPKKRSAVVRESHEQIERELWHGELQETLHRRLARQFGRENVGTENPAKNGTSIDLVVRHHNGYWFYEIKTAASARACIREALGQILEYAFWPGAQDALRLIIAGPRQIDKSGKEYLRILRRRFRLPIEYEQL
jgi:hypothetical protein